jgi:hypothetical protein
MAAKDKTTLTLQVENLFADGSGIEATAAKLAEAIAIEDDALTALDVEVKRRKAALDQQKTQLADLMIGAGLDSLKLANGLTPSVALRRKFLKAQGVTDEQLHQWLRTAGLGSIVKETVHFGSLQSTLKAHEEAEGDIPSDIFNVKDERTIRLHGKSKFLARRTTAEPAGD